MQVFSVKNSKIVIQMRKPALEVSYLQMTMPEIK